MVGEENLREMPCARGVYVAGTILEPVRTKSAQVPRVMMCGTVSGTLRERRRSPKGRQGYWGGSRRTGLLVVAMGLQGGLG